MPATAVLGQPLGWLVGQGEVEQELRMSIVPAPKSKVNLKAEGNRDFGQHTGIMSLALEKRIFNEYPRHQTAHLGVGVCRTALRCGSLCPGQFGSC